MLSLSTIPSLPGCYLYKDKTGKIIYVGKAKDLKKRVSSYFSKKQDDAKTQSLVENINNVEFFVTSNEVEALVLENNLIKKHQPRYNINLKDSKRYAYIFIPEEKFPRMLIARSKEQKGSYYGPFVSAEQRDAVIKTLRGSFQIRTCSKLPKKACLRYHLKLCSAPCIQNISEQDYQANLKNAEYFLKGHGKQLQEKLKTEMKQYSEKRLYEKAKIIRDQIQALDGLEQKQRFEQDKKYDEDILNYIIANNKVYLIVFNIIKGILATKNEFSFDYTPDFLEEFITQYYSENKIPKEIILPHELQDSSIKEYLESIKKSKITITIPQKGEKLELLELVKRNIEANFLAQSQMTNALREELNLQSNPEVIECFDNSNISGTSAVASMVQFRNAKPDKSNYRRFKIKTVIGSDDFASMYEVVSRRYSRLKKENMPIPDLVVIDGGPGQLNAAIEALTSLGLKIPIISLAKKFEEIYLPGKNIPIRLKKDSKGLKLLIQIRNEAHRFAIKYHRQLRSKNMLE